MIRNQFVDPESSPSKSKGDMYNNNSTYDNGSNDEWFSGTDNSSQASIQSSYSGGGGGLPYLHHQGGGGAMGSSSMGGGGRDHHSNILNDSDDYSNEPPLLEELGIRFDHILSKTQAVINPTKQLDEHLLDDADLAGPLFFCLLLGACLLMSGKVHFGYIYGFSIFGCVSLWTVLNLLHNSGLDIWKTCSVLGYSLLPVISLAAISIIISLKGILGTLLAILAIVWSTYAAARIFDAKLGLTDQYWLIVYPISLLYSCFVLITIF